MKEWAYTFDAVSKEKWIRQIETDLRQKPVSSLQSAWWPDALLMPLVHPEDIYDEPVRLPDSFFEEPPLITEMIEAGGMTAALVNQQILKALQQGAQSIIIRLNPGEQLLDERWLEGVNREMVTLALQPANIKKETIADLKKSLTERIQLRCERHDQTLSFNELIYAFSQESHLLKSLKFIYRFPSSGIWDKEAAHVFNILFADLNTWLATGFDATSFFAQCILALEADQTFFKQIIQTRVLHMIWQNLRAHHGDLTSDIHQHYLECHINQNQQEKPANFLIRASMSALAASLSGTHGLCIHHSHQPEASFFERNNRNLHHLLHLESGMYKGTDPLAGAYALDYHTTLWTKSIWEQLNLQSK